MKCIQNLTTFKSAALRLDHDGVRVVRVSVGLRQVDIGAPQYEHLFEPLPANEAEWLAAVEQTLESAPPAALLSRVRSVFVGGLDAAAETNESAPGDAAYRWFPMRAKRRAGVRKPNSRCLWIGLRVVSLRKLQDILTPYLKFRYTVIPQVCIRLADRSVDEATAEPGAARTRVVRNCGQVVIAGGQSDDNSTTGYDFARMIYVGRCADLWKTPACGDFIRAEKQRMIELGFPIQSPTQDHEVHTVDTWKDGMIIERRVWQSWLWEESASERADPRRWKRAVAVAGASVLIAMAGTAWFERMGEPAPRTDRSGEGPAPVGAAAAEGAAQRASEALAQRWNSVPMFTHAMRDVSRALESVGDCWIAELTWNARESSGASSDSLSVVVQILNSAFPQRVDQSDCGSRARALTAALGGAATIAGIESESFDGSDARFLECRYTLRIAEPNVANAQVEWVDDINVLRERLQAERVVERAADVLGEEMRLARLADACVSIGITPDLLRTSVGEVGTPNRNLRMDVMEALALILDNQDVSIGRIQWNGAVGDELQAVFEGHSSLVLALTAPVRLWATQPKLRIQYLRWRRDPQPKAEAVLRPQTGTVSMEIAIATAASAEVPMTSDHPVRVALASPVDPLDVGVSADRFAASPLEPPTLNHDRETGLWVVPSAAVDGTAGDAKLELIEIRFESFPIALRGWSGDTDRELWEFEEVANGFWHRARTGGAVLGGRFELVKRTGRPGAHGEERINGIRILDTQTQAACDLYCDEPGPVCAIARVRGAGGQTWDLEVGERERVNGAWMRVEAIDASASEATLAFENGDVMKLKMEIVK